MSTVQNSNNKTIAKNTLALYLRMFLVMAVGLYTSRVILQTLGVSDYGIYNVIGGFVTMLAYLNKIFVEASQRFIVYALGEKNEKKLKTVFTTSISVHLLISLLILIVAETFGLWFVNEKLVIEPDRSAAANWVYQCSVFSLIVTVINVPYRACVVAHEKMHIYAYFAIVEVILKLAIVFMLLLTSKDRLITYAIFHLAVSVLIPIWNWAYCRKNFGECICRFNIDKGLFREMISFSGWTLIGSLGFSFKDQFSNIIMNTFLGTTINAARGIATQVNGIVMSFAENFTTAIAPQITKQYAGGNISQSQKLVTVGSRYSFFLMSCFTIPLLLNIDYILHLWLVDVPQYTASFVAIALISNIFYSASKTYSVAIQATGNIKWFQIGVCLIMLSELPIAYFLLAKGFPPYYALLPAIFTNLTGVLYRMLLIKKQIEGYNLCPLLKDLFIRCTSLMTISYLISFCIFRNNINSFVNVILSVLFSSTVNILVIYLFGIDKKEKYAIKYYINNKIRLKR